MNRNRNRKEATNSYECRRWKRGKEKQQRINPERKSPD
jgi:hypothetical protein